MNSAYYKNTKSKRTSENQSQLSNAEMNIAEIRAKERLPGKNILTLNYDSLRLRQHPHEPKHYLLAATPSILNRRRLFTPSCGNLIKSTAESTSETDKTH